MVFLSIPYKVSIFVGLVSNSTIAMYNDTNETASDGWTYNDQMKLLAFFDQLKLAHNVIYPLMAIFTCAGNTLVLVATWRERSLHQPNKYFIACLAVADLVVGMLVEPFRMYQSNLDDESLLSTSIHVCRFMTWIDTFALTASVYSLTFISFDRYLKISKPLQYKSRMTTSKSLKIIFTIWLISTAWGAYATTIHSGSGSTPCTWDHNKSKLFYTFMAVGDFFLPTVFILVMYSRIFVVAHERQKMVRNGELGETPNDQNQRTAFLQDLKVIRMLLVVVGVFILCWGPSFVWTLLNYYYPNFIDSNSTSLSYVYKTLITDSLLNILPYINSLCNPIIYACLDQKYREAFKNLFLRMMCRRSS